MIGKIFNIQRFSLNDGPGIRTTVFLKGCPLSCKWCHNPESKSKKYEIMYSDDMCVKCRGCVGVCERGCHVFENGTHVFERELCASCKKCVSACFYGALEGVGEDQGAADVIEKVMRDETFYKNSGGGMTLSGGEPLYQFEFALELLKLAKEKGLHTCIETSGYTSEEKIKEIAKYTDVFLYDFKLTSDKLHKEYTGVSNKLIISNLLAVDEGDSEIILRCPIIPSVNDTDEHFHGIADMANRLKNIIAVEVEPYHPLGKSKSEKLGMEYTFSDLDFAKDDEVKKWIDKIASKTDVAVRKA